MASAIDIIFPGNLPQVETIAALRLVPSAPLEDEDVYLVSTVGLYRWEPSSLAADDGAAVIRPADLTPLQAGRWLVVASAIDKPTDFDALGDASVAADTGAVLLGDGQIAVADMAVTPTTAAQNPGFETVTANGRGFRKAFRPGRTYDLRLDFGCPMDGTDQTAYLEAAMRYLRAKDNNPIIIGDGAGSRLACTNPFVYNGLRKAKWDGGDGAEIINPHAAVSDFDQNFAAVILANSPWSPNGWRTLTYGTGQGPNANDFGLQVKQVQAGASFIDWKAGDLFRGPGWVLLYSNCRDGTLGGVPPIAINYEFVYVARISGDGKRAFLRDGDTVQNTYEEYAPYYNVGGSGPCGPAACVQFERPDGQFRATIASEYQEWTGWRLLKNPAIIGTGIGEPLNGGGYFGSLHFVGRDLIAEGNIGLLTARTMDIEITSPEVEIDKFVERISIGGTIGNLVGGTGTKHYHEKPSLKRTGYMTVNAIDTMTIAGEHRGSDGPGTPSGALMAVYGWPVRSLKVSQDATFHPLAQSDRLAYTGGMSCGIQAVESDGALRIARGLWDASGWSTGAQEGVSLYDPNGTEVFRLTGLPTCYHSTMPTPNTATGNIYLYGQHIGAGVATGNVLWMDRFPSVTWDQGVTVKGPYAAQVQTMFGVDLALQDGVGRVQDARHRGDTLTLDSTMRRVPNTSGQLGDTCGENSDVLEIVVSVTQAATSAGTLAVQNVIANGSTQTAITVDLTRVGRRVMYADGTNTGLGGADVAGAFPTDPVRQVVAVTSLYAAARGAGGRWHVTYRFVPAGKVF